MRKTEENGQETTDPSLLQFSPDIVGSLHLALPPLREYYFRYLIDFG